MRLGLFAFMGGLLAGFVAVVVPSLLVADPLARTDAAVPGCRPAPLATRAGLVLMVEVPEAAEPDGPPVDDVLDAGAGGVLLAGDNVGSPGQVRQLTAALERGASHPLLVAAEEEAAAAGGAGSPIDARDLGEDLGAALASLGVEVNLAPVADHADTPEEVGRYAVALARGLADRGVLPTAALRGGDQAPLRELVDAGVPLVRVASRHGEEQYARLRDMGFDGVAVTDAADEEAAVAALAAGADLVLAHDGTMPRRLRDAVVAAVEDGTVPDSRLDEAVGRVLALSAHDGSGIVCGSVPAAPALAAR